VEALSGDAALSIWQEHAKFYRVRDTATGKLLFEIPAVHDRVHQRRPFFLRDNRTAILWAEPNGLRAWNPAWKTDRLIPFPEADWPDTFVLSPDGMIVAGIHVQAVRFWRFTVDNTPAEKQGPK